jgi:AraC-like DNA-binding protein
MIGKLLPASMLPGLLEIALRSRLDVQSLFEHAGIDADILGRSDRYITLAQLDTLLSTAFQRTSDPLFGLHVGRDNHYNNLDLLGNLMATSSTLEQALSLLFRYKDLLVPYLEFQLLRDEHHCRLAAAAGEALTFTRMRAHNELVVATMVAIGRSLMGGRMPMQRVAFRYAAPDAGERAEYDAFFQCELLFGANANAIEFSPALLGQPLPGAFPKYRLRLEHAAARLLGSLNRAGGVTGQVLAHLNQGLGHGTLTVECTARRMNMAARTLQRHLRDEGTRFAQLRDQVRMEYACRRLGAADCDMQTLATHLGFSDTANFYHAFKRWKGCAPGEYRRRLRR